MRLKEILKEGMHDVIRGLVRGASEELFNHPNAYGTRGGWKVWTRGDGMRYRDPNVIMFQNESAKDMVSGKEKYINKASKAEWHPIYKKMAETDHYKAMQMFWDWLKEQPKVKQANFRVSGEFGSSGYRDVLTLGPYIFILDGNQIQYGTKSLLRNSPIWRVEKL